MILNQRMHVSNVLVAIRGRLRGRGGMRNDICTGDHYIQQYSPRVSSEAVVSE